MLEYKSKEDRKLTCFVHFYKTETVLGTQKLFSKYPLSEISPRFVLLGHSLFPDSLCLRGVE